MRVRIARDLALDNPAELRVYTFHSLALRCLQRKPHLAGLPERIEVWGAQQGRAVFGARAPLLERRGRQSSTSSGAPRSSCSTRSPTAAASRGTTRSATARPSSSPSTRRPCATPAPSISPTWCRCCSAPMGDNPAYGRAVAGAVDHLLVDEYQDINLGQHRLIEHFRSGGGASLGGGRRRPDAVHLPRRRHPLHAGLQAPPRRCRAPSPRPQLPLDARHRGGAPSG